MVRTEEQRDFHVNNWITSHHARSQRVAHTFFNCRDVFARNGTALDRVNEFEALARFLRFDLQNHVTVLTTTTRLLDEFAFRLFAHFTDRFAVSHLWLADGRFNVEFALHAVNDDVQMQLAHTGDDGLARFFIVRTRNDGSSAARRFSARPIFPGRPWFLARLPAKSPAQGRPCAPERRLPFRRKAYRQWWCLSDPRRQRCRQRAFP